MTGKGALDGLKIVAGPEIYWGANPKGWSSTTSTPSASTGPSSTPRTFPPRSGRERHAGDDPPVAPDDAVRPDAGGPGEDRGGRHDGFHGAYRRGVRPDRRSGQHYRPTRSTLRIRSAFRGKLTFPVFGAETYVSTWQAGLVSESSATPQPTFGRVRSDAPAVLRSRQQARVRTRVDHQRRQPDDLPAPDVPRQPGRREPVRGAGHQPRRHAEPGADTARPR
jgi:hypothetical protein